jgi:pilus assembly protein CpaB
LKNKLAIVLAVLFGLITVVLVSRFLSLTKSALDKTDYTEIIVASQAIPANTKISEIMISKKTIPTQYKHGKEIVDKSLAVGKISLIPISEGVSILENQLVESGDFQQGLAYAIPEGKRAMAIQVDEVSSVAGMLKTGDRVDITTTIPLGENPSVPHTVVVLQDVEVLAVGKSIDNTGGSEKVPIEAKTVTVAVSLEDSLPLKMANQWGNISLLLRPPADKATSNPNPFKAIEFLK